jgi:hypothetical protein
MTTPSFINRLNWPLILLNIAACWFFAYGFALLSYLFDMDLFRFALKYNGHFNRNDLPRDFVNRSWLFALRSNLSPIVGELTACFISFSIAFKKRWFWVNSVFPLFVTFLLFRFNISGWHWLKYIFLTPGEMFGYPSAGYFIFNGSTLVVLGLLCLFLPITVKSLVRTENHSRDTAPGSELSPTQDPV